MPKSHRRTAAVAPRENHDPAPRRPFRLSSRIALNDDCAGGDFVEAFIAGRIPMAAAGGESINATLNADASDGFSPHLYISVPSGDFEDGIVLTADEIDAFGQCLQAMAQRMREWLPDAVTEMRQWHAEHDALRSRYRVSNGSLS